MGMFPLSEQLCVAGREKFFERERDVDPDVFLWDGCVFDCGNV